MTSPVLNDTISNILASLGKHLRLPGTKRYTAFMNDADGTVRAIIVLETESCVGPQFQAHCAYNPDTQELDNQQRLLADAQATVAQAAQDSFYGNMDTQNQRELLLALLSEAMFLVLKQPSSLSEQEVIHAEDRTQAQAHN